MLSQLICKCALHVGEISALAVICAADIFPSLSFEYVYDAFLPAKMLKFDVVRFIHFFLCSFEASCCD